MLPPLSPVWGRVAVYTGFGGNTWGNETAWKTQA